MEMGLHVCLGYLLADRRVVANSEEGPLTLVILSPSLRKLSVRWIG